MWSINPDSNYEQKNCDANFHTGVRTVMALKVATYNPPKDEATLNKINCPTPDRRRDLTNRDYKVYIRSFE